MQALIVIVEVPRSSVHRGPTPPTMVAPRLQNAIQSGRRLSTPEGQGCIDPDPCPSVYAQGATSRMLRMLSTGAPHRRFGCVDAWFGRWIGHGWFECAKDPQDNRRPRGVVFSSAMKREQAPLILGIERPATTSAAVIRGPHVLATLWPTKPCMPRWEESSRSGLPGRTCPKSSP